MKPFILSAAFVAAMAFPAAHAMAGACGNGPIDTPDAVASHLVSDLYAGATLPQADGSLSFAEQQLDPALRAMLPEQALKQAWVKYQGQAGVLTSLGGLSDAPQGDSTVVTVPTMFSQGSGVVKVTVTPDLTVIGLTFLPSDAS